MKGCIDTEQFGAKENLLLFGYPLPPFYDLPILRGHQAWLSDVQDSGSVQNQSEKGRGTSKLGNN